MSSKQWWKLANSLQGRGKNMHGVQALQRTDCTWARSARDKAQLLSETFLHKAQLPPPVVNEYSMLPPEKPGSLISFLPVRDRMVRKQLCRLSLDSATGPDGISARVLKKCAVALSQPLARLIRAMISGGRWPACWGFHHIVPLYKKESSI